MTNYQLLQKYDIPVPRYTSFPTVPYWDFSTLTTSVWQKNIRHTFQNENGVLCLYIHLPFCEELCTYCACNKYITKNHQVETPYVDSLLAEWNMYRAIFDKKPIIKEIHLGGGTPTFFSPENLTKLIQGIIQDSIVGQEHEFSVEVHPNYTTLAHLQALKNVGFNRISVGVQDFDTQVQHIINRPQSFEQTQQVVKWAKELHYESINIDLVYGLPRQTPPKVAHTIGLVRQLKPDRIAFYSYAHVPWKSKAQRRYTNEDVPKADEKLVMYQTGSQLLEQDGWQRIGMDHFALPSDKLLKAYQQGTIHRNFMGYTTTNHKLLIGLGVSAISDTWTAFAQNEKTVDTYQQKIKEGILPLVNGHLLTNQDIITRQHILNLMCRNQTYIQQGDYDKISLEKLYEKLAHLAEDNLITLQEHHLSVTPHGRQFIRVICAAFDNYLPDNNLQQNIFSKAL